MTLQELHKAATEKGYNYQLFSNKFKYYGGLRKPSLDTQYEGTRETFFGFTKDDKVWFWFNIIEDDFILFDHRYNAVNGSTIKSIKQEWNAKYILGLQDWK
jgi:hypothetical protein